MAIVSPPTLLTGTRLVSISPPKLIPQARNSYNPITISHKNIFTRTCAYVAKGHSPLLHQPLIETSFSSRHRGLLQLVPSSAKTSSGSGEEDNPAVDTVLKLYTAIKNQNIKELSDIIGDECRCQVLDFFKVLIKFLGNNLEFVVQPTLQDGLIVGVAWRLNWSKTHIPVGKGFSFYILQVYQGRVVIRNVEMFMEPLVHIEPFRMKMMGYAMNIIDKMSCCKLSKDKVKKAIQHWE
ncbi:unnamed protein product [Dovyalis caffra]|uniref:Uncharacterized protein n=1 Tax=Dovyalis caffra TaxID=77055 RepID=A0AAV1S2S9_9ROSI|nr:unnamed protein product [Dovyalis caffra]